MKIKTLGTRIRQERKRVNLTLEELADLVGISTSFMGYIERNEKSPSLETVNQLAKALRVPCADLFRTEEIATAHDPVDAAAKAFALLIAGQTENQIVIILNFVKMYVKTIAGNASKRARRKS